MSATAKTIEHETGRAIAERKAESATMMQIIDKAVANPDLDVEKLERLLEMKRQWDAEQARKAFADAMAEFQARCPTIKKSRSADRYVYAPLDEILRTIRPHLESAGLSIRFDTETTEHGIKAVCTVQHRDGHSETSHFSAPVDAQMRVNETQKMGSANSYAKRYSLMNALNLVASEYDDDGYAAGVEFISEDEAAKIRDYIESLEIDEPAFLKYLSVESVEEIPRHKLNAAMTAIKRKEKAQK